MFSLLPKLLVLHLELGTSSGVLGPFVSTWWWLTSVSKLIQRDCPSTWLGWLHFGLSLAWSIWSTLGSLPLYPDSPHSACVSLLWFLLFITWVLWAPCVWTWVWLDIHQSFYLLNSLSPMYNFFPINCAQFCCFDFIACVFHIFTSSFDFCAACKVWCLFAPLPLFHVREGKKV